MSLVQLIIVLAMYALLSSNKMDYAVRIWFGLGRIRSENATHQKYERWISFFAFCLFAVLFYRAGLDSPYTYLFILLLFSLLYGFKAWLNIKCNRHSNDWKATLSTGLLKAVLLMMLTAIFTLAV